MTLADVLARWAARDERYRRRRRLTPDEVASIRIIREHELEGLSAKERLAGRIAIGQWRPPGWES